MKEPSDILRDLSTEAATANLGMLSLILSLVADYPLHESTIRADMQARLLTMRNSERSPAELRILDRAILALA